MRFFILIFLTMLFLSGSIRAIDYYDTTKVDECKRWCNPNSNSNINLSDIEFISADEYKFIKTIKQGQCFSISDCKADCWTFYQTPGFTSYNPLPTAQESRLAIGNFTLAMHENEDLDEMYCTDHHTFKWASAGYYSEKIARHYENLNETVKAAKAYSETAAYFELYFESGHDTCCTNRDTLAKAAGSYRQAGKTYCDKGLDDAAHLEFEKAKAAYQKQNDYKNGSIALSSLFATVDGEECGKYEKEETVELCPSTFIIFVFLGFTSISILKGGVL